MLRYALFTLFLLAQFACSLPIGHKKSQQLSEVLQYHQKNGGSTYCFHLEGNMQGAAYFAVGVFPKKGLKLIRQLQIKDLEAFVQKHQDFFDQDYCLGTWKENKKSIYLDIVQVVPHTAGLAVATSLAQKHQQIAIFNLLNQQVIKIKPPQK